MCKIGLKQSSAELKETQNNTKIHPVLPGNGQFIIGQEQEKLCGGYDDYDSLSADVSQFQVLHFYEISSTVGQCDL